MVEFKGQWAKLSRTYMSLLVQPQAMLVSNEGGADRRGLVLDTTDHGAIVWHVSPHRHGDFRWWSWEPTSPQGWSQLSITDVNWVVIEIEVRG